jgi:hypothetical protein
MAKTTRLSCLVFALVLTPALAHAQGGLYQVRNPAVGETYHLEFSFGLWDAAPGITLATDAVQVAGAQIDGVADLGFVQKKVPDLHLVLRLARKHKIRFEYLPISYAADAVVTRVITFQGISYTLGVPISSALDWKAYRFGYEYDMVYRDRGFFGIIGTVEYAKLRASLVSPFASGSLDERAPIPAIGTTARVYVTRNVAASGEVSIFRVPHELIQNASGHYLDYDVYGTANFTNNAGVQGGYRSRDAWFESAGSSANVKLKGWYFRGVVRF